PLRRHNRWLVALSHTSRGSVRGCPASNLYVSYHGRGEQSGLRRRGQPPQGPSSPTTQTESRAPEHASSQAGGPHEKTARSTTRGVVHLAVFVRPTAPEQNRTEDPVARQPWGAPVTGAACDHRTGVRVVRSALSDPDRPRQTGQVAAARPAIHLPR